jgi:hypothetical protein
MNAAQYFVLRSDDEWKIKFREELFGPYRTQNEALLFAIDAAQEIGKRENAAQVLVEAAPDRFITRWSYGDPVQLPLG